MSRQVIQKLVAAALLTTGVALLSVAAQTPTQEQAAKLRAQLADVQAQQDQNQLRLQQLEEALKPENIESSLAGMGSTHPEELRAQRRQQLEKQKTAVQLQLDQLAVSRGRLETAVAAADARAYQESARGPQSTAAGPQTPPVEAGTSTAATQSSKSTKSSRRRHPRRTARRPAAATPATPKN